MYQLDKPEKVLGEVQQFDREVQLRTIFTVMQYRIDNGGCSISEACRELDIPYSRVIRWLKDGVLTDYLETVQDPEIEMLKSRAIEAMPGVLEYMISLASGKTNVRGVNPVAAATFVKDILDAGSRKKEEESPQMLIQNNFFPPQQYKVGYKDLAPMIEVIDVESEELD